MLKMLKIIILWIATFRIDVFYITHLVDTIFFSVWFFFSEVFRHCKWVSVLREPFAFFVWNNTALKNECIHLIFFTFQFWWLLFGFLLLTWCLMIWKLFHSGRKCSKCLWEAENQCWSDSVWCSFKRFIGHSPWKFLFDTRSCNCELFPYWFFYVPSIKIGKFLLSSENHLDLISESRINVKIFVILFFNSPTFF